MQADFHYQPMRDAAGMQLGATIVTDRALVADILRDDAEAAGMRILHCCSFEEFSAAGISSLGDVVLVDCAVPDASVFAQMARIDLRAGKSGALCIVSTVIGALDAVFGCFSLSRAQILVDPCRSERVIAIGRALAEVPNLRLRELGEEDRLMLLRLTEQVARMAQRIEGLSPGQGAGGSAFRLESPTAAWRAAGEEYAMQRPAPPLPDAAAIRALIRARQARARFLDGELFADPAWDILLDFAAARAERSQVCVTSLCIAAGVPATTALRWIGQMVESGILVRVPDAEDRRRAFIALADATADALARYFAEIGIASRQMVAV